MFRMDTVIVAAFPFAAWHGLTAARMGGREIDFQTFPRLRSVALRSFSNGLSVPVFPAAPPRYPRIRTWAIFRVVLAAVIDGRRQPLYLSECLNIV
jgi:hypothetical protein